MTILALDNVSKSYGALRVTDSITLSVQAGETLGILGPNGAGKTTLFNLISGDVRTDAGRVQFDGRDITREPPHKRCRLGIGRSYQIPQPFAAMTVFENLVAAASFGANRPERETYQHAVEILRATGLLPKANRLAGSLTLLDRKRLELARALATEPKVLLLDEIAGGLTEHEAHELVDLRLGEPAGHLVQQQHPRPGGQGAGQLQALALQQGQAAGHPVGVGGEPGQFQRLQAGPVGVGPSPPGGQA